MPVVSPIADRLGAVMSGDDRLPLVISTDDAGSAATEEKWRDPDTVCRAMPIQGILPGLFPS
jgi:hypothetical protein